MAEILISFVIPHYGREHLLVQAVQSIIDQSFDLEKVEVIIATQNSELSEAIKAYKRKIALTILPQSSTNTISMLRNQGVKQSKGKYIAFIDADVSISPDWISCMLEELENSADGRSIVSAIQANSEKAPAVEKIRTILNNINRNKNVDALHGSNLFLKRDTFDATGGFPEDLKTCEDVYFTTEAGRFGLLYLTSAATHIHLGEDKDYKIMFNKEIWRGQSNIQSIKGRKIPLREIPSLIIPLGFLALLTVCLLFLLLELYNFSLLAFLLLLFPVIVYSLRLLQYSTDKNLNSLEIFKFYLVYFTARSIGTYKGMLLGR